MCLIYWWIDGLIFGHAVQHVGSSSPTRDQTCAPCSGSAESWPLDRQGSLLPFILGATSLFMVFKSFLFKYSWFTMLCEFLVYSKVIQLYIYILFLFFSIWFITGYWIEFPVLCSRTLLFIRPIYSSLRLLNPNSRSIPPPHPLPLGNHKSVLYVYQSVSVL